MTAGAPFRGKQLGSFRDPVYVTGPKGAKGLRFVVEKSGRVITVSPNGKKSVFLDIRGRVSDSGERGLLSVAFPADYAQSRLLYIYFTDNRGDIIIAEVKRSRDNPKRAKASTLRRVIRVKHRLNENHNGGQVQFGPDGYLYFATGDGGSGGDPDENAQNLDSLLGKLIRIDPRKSGTQPYTIPPGNPFVGTPGRDEIFSFGLRNPYRFSFDSQTGDLAIGDVGQEEWEELNLLTRSSASGANFGWDGWEGFELYTRDGSDVPADQVTFPIFAYSHANGSCSITGGFVSHDPKTPALDGRYVYADYCRSQIRSLDPTAADPGATDKPLNDLPTYGGISSFGEDTRGRIYFADLPGDAVYEIAPGG